MATLTSHWPRILLAMGLLLMTGGKLYAFATVTTLGGGMAGNTNGNTWTEAWFNLPAGMALDPSGKYLFLADYNNNAIRLVSQVGDRASSVTTTFANAANGAGVSHPIAVVVDAATNVYVLNQGNGAVLHLGGVLINSGLMQVYPPLATGLVNATAMAMDGYNNLYVTVNGNTVIRVTTNGVITTIGTVTQGGASLKGIAVLDNGQLALSDAGNHGVWIMNPSTGASTKLTGFHGAADVVGASTVAAFNAPATISKAANGVLVIADYGNHKVKLVDATGSVGLLYGVSSSLWITGAGQLPGWFDGLGRPDQGYAEARLPYGVLVAPDGSVYTTEDYYHVLRHVTDTGLSGPQPGYPPTIIAPGGIALNPAGNLLYITDSTNNLVQLLNLGNNKTTTFLNSSSRISHPASVMTDPSGFVYVLNQNAGTNGNLLQFDNLGNFLGTNMTGLVRPTSLAMDGSGTIYITELAGKIKTLTSGVSNTLVTISTNIVTLKTNVQLQGIAIFDDGYLAVSDAGNHVIWTVNPVTKLVTKLTGQLGTNGATLGASNVAKLYQPHQLARTANNQLVIADYGNNRLAVATRSGSITNVLVSTNSQVWQGLPNDPSTGASVPMLLPAGVAVSSSGLVYDSEPVNALVRRLTLPASNLSGFNGPQGLAFDSFSDYLFVADYANNAVRLLDLNTNVTYTFLTAMDGVSSPAAVLVDTNENVYVLNQGTPGNGYIEEYDIYGNNYGPIVTGLNQPTAFTLDGYGNLLVAEQAGNIRVFGTGLSNTIVTITNAAVSLQGIAIFDDGVIAVSDAGNHVIWTVNPITKLVTKLTGQLHTNGIAVGASNFAKLYQPHQLVRVAGNQIVCADYGNNRLVLVQRNGTVITNNATYHLNSSTASIWFGQSDDPIASGNAKFVPMVHPFGVAAGVGGQLFASETDYKDIRQLTGTGITSPSFNPGVPLPFYSSPAGIALNTSSTILFVADPTNNVVSALNLANNLTSIFLDASSGLQYPVDVSLDSSDNLYVLNRGTGSDGRILEFDRFGNLLATNAAGLALPSAMTLDNSGNLLVAELDGLVLKVSAGVTTTIATVTNAGVQLQGIALFTDGTIVVSDAASHVLWQVDPVTKAVSLFTGQTNSPGKTFGSPAFAKFNQPHQLKLAAGNLLVTADSGNNRIVIVDRSGSITNALNSTNATVWFGLAGDPVASSNPQFVQMVSPVGVAIGLAGGVFASETYYDDIRELLGTGLIQPGPGGGGGTGTNIVVVPPTISPDSGYYPMGQTIRVTSPNPNVFYTTDGSDPTTNSNPVSISGNIGFIHWFNTTNDLTSLRVKSFVNGTNASVTVAGQPVPAGNIGVPPDFNPALQAGIGATVVIPIVCNLPTNQQVRSFQFRVEIAPLGNPNTPSIAPLSIFPTNDFVPLVTAAQSGFVATYSMAPYSLGITNGMQIFAVGADTHVLFHNYAVVALLEVQIPYGANVGDTYALNVLYPSATADAYNTPVSLTAMAPATITVTNIPYTVGDSASASGSWYNAGTFGDNNLDNSDVNQAFYAASGLRVPYTFTDVFNAMDAYPPDAAGFVGGDGQIRFLDWVTILQRSLRLDPANWSREWSPGGILINSSTNLTPARALVVQLAANKSVSAPWYRQVLLGASSIGNASPNATVFVPLYAKLADGAALSGMQFRAVVTPLNGAPDLTDAPQLALAAGVTSPLLSKSFKPGQTAFGWQLGSFNYSSRSSNFLGWISFSIPTNAITSQTYQVSLDNADGAPDLTNQYDFESRSAYVTVNAPASPASICSDEWKAHFFGSVTNPAAADNADPDGDGVPNWIEFLAGTDPTSNQSKLQLSTAGLTSSKSQKQMQLNWLTAPGRAYAVQWSPSLVGGSWTTISTISGDGSVTNCADINPSSSTRYYRLFVLP